MAGAVAESIESPAPEQVRGRLSPSAAPAALDYLGLFLTQITKRHLVLLLRYSEPNRRSPDMVARPWPFRASSHRADVAFPYFSAENHARVLTWPTPFGPPGKADYPGLSRMRGTLFRRQPRLRRHPPVRRPRAQQKFEGLGNAAKLANMRIDATNALLTSVTEEDFEEKLNDPRQSRGLIG